MLLRLSRAINTYLRVSAEQELHRLRMHQQLTHLRSSARNDLKYWYYSYRCDGSYSYRCYGCYGSRCYPKRIRPDRFVPAYMIKTTPRNEKLYHFGSIAQCSCCMNYLQFHTQTCQCCLLTRAMMK
jgi:hypothetical protein